MTLRHENGAPAKNLPRGRNARVPANNPQGPWRLAATRGSARVMQRRRTAHAEDGRGVGEARSAPDAPLPHGAQSACFRTTWLPRGPPSKRPFCMRSALHKQKTPSTPPRGFSYLPRTLSVVLLLSTAFRLELPEFARRVTGYLSHPEVPAGGWPQCPESDPKETSALGAATAAMKPRAGIARIAWFRLCQVANCYRFAASSLHWYRATNDAWHARPQLPRTTVCNHHEGRRSP